MSSDTHTFTCGACGTSVTGIHSLAALARVMVMHSRICPAVCWPPQVDDPIGDVDE